MPAQFFYVQGGWVMSLPFTARRSRTLLLALCLLAVLPACAASKSQPLAEAGEAVRKDSLVLAVGAEPEGGFDPTTGWGRYGSPLIQSTLLKRKADMSLTGDLAQGVERSEDGLRWKVALREDALFSDGRPVTAEDVKFTFDTAKANGSVIDLTNLAAVETAGSYEVEFILKAPQSTFGAVLASTGIVPRHAYGNDYASRPIGSGPYKLIQWDKGQQVIMEANELYYGGKLPFQRLTLLFLSEDAAFAAAKSGAVDMAYIPATFSKQQVAGYRLERAGTVDNRGISFPYVRSGGRTEKGDPIGNDVTSDLAIRKAINVAIDRQALVDGVLEGYGTPAYTIVDGLPWWNAETVFADGDMEQARRLLSEGGWTDADHDGIVEKEGRKAQFQLLYPAGDVIRQSLALAAADQVHAIGIDMQVEGKSWSEIERWMASSAVLWGWGSQDPMEMYNVYSSKYRGVGYYNVNYYSNKKADEWMERALRASSEEEAASYWQLAQWDGETGLSERGDAPWAWLVNVDHLYLVKEQLHIGTQRIHPHGHGWPVTDNITEWTWRP